MQQEIRQRKNVTSSSMDSSSTPFRQPTALSAPSMLQASPQHYEYVMKLRIPAFFSVLPRFLQNIICRFSFLSFLAPTWERRFLILLGGYLYKFQTDTNPSAEPKGTPLAIDAVDINLLDSEAKGDMTIDDASLAFALLPPPACLGLFVVSTLRKRHYYATGTADDASTWVHSLRQARDEAIKRKMGHAAVDSYPTKWTHYDRLGKGVADRKDRIRRRMEESNIRELEMSNLSEGGAAPRGYYG